MDPTFNPQTINDPADQPPPAGFNGFTNLLGINNFGEIAGFFGSGAMGDPNTGFLRTPNGAFIPENFPESAQNPVVAQTQVTGLNDTGVTVGYFYKTNLGVAIDDQFGFYEKNGLFTEVNNPHTPTPSQVEPGVSPQIENQLLGGQRLQYRGRILQRRRRQ
jgi:hypothetical protein